MFAQRKIPNTESAFLAFSQHVGAWATQAFWLCVVHTLNKCFCGKVMFSCFQQSMALSEKRWRHTQKAAKKKNISECWLAWVSWNLCPCSLDWGYQSPFCGETWPVCICQIPFLPAQLKRLQRPTQLCQLWSWWTQLMFLFVPSHLVRRLSGGHVKTCCVIVVWKQEVVYFVREACLTALI